MNRDLTAFIIMDGYGLDEASDTNAISIAKKPNLDAIMAKYPTTSIRCSGSDVGLPDGQMGNSEVGHLNLGAGRIIYQPLTRISKDILDGGFFENPALISAMENAIKNNSALHLLGLVSDGGVHSHMDHLLACVEMARQYGISKVYIHCFMDGRDVAPRSGLDFIQELEASLAEIGLGKIATISGRFYAMDRDNIFERVSLAYSAIVDGEGVMANTAIMAMEQSYLKDESDEFIMPSIITCDNAPTGKVNANDSIIFFNFRPDRARQLTRSFIDVDFDGFNRKAGYLPTEFITMTVYDVTFKNVKVAYYPETFENTLGQYLAANNKTQLRIAETQKYAHVTYFFNGGIEEPNDGEIRVLVDSPKIATFDMKPEMSAYEVTEAVLKEIDKDKFDAIIMNYANCDMVGHTGIVDATVKAVEAVDACVGKVVEAVLAKGGRLMISADHGNAEKMWDYVAKVPYTAHTVESPVPFILVDDEKLDVTLRKDGRLADVAPTMLELMGMVKPSEMTGESLIG